jgi:hypothetical protein
LIIIRLVENGRATLMRFSRSSVDFHADSTRDCFSRSRTNSEPCVVRRALTLTITLALRCEKVARRNLDKSHQIFASLSLSRARAPRFVRTRNANRGVNLAAEWRGCENACSEGENSVERSPSARLFELPRILRIPASIEAVNS